MAALLLAVPAPDTVRATALYRAALDEIAALRYDSALVLLHGAAELAPGFLPAHARINALVFESPNYVASLAVRRPAAASRATALGQCLALVAASRQSHFSAVPGLARLERNGARSSCSTYYLAERGVEEPGPWTAAAARRASELVPGLPDAWAASARWLARQGRGREAVALLQQGLGRMTHPLERVELVAALVSIDLAVGDTSRAFARYLGLRNAIARDGRPGLWRHGEKIPGRPVSWPGSGLTERLAEALAANHPLAEWSARFTLARAAIEGGDPQAAIAALARVVRIADSAAMPGLQVHAYLQLGRAMAKRGQLGDAERALTRAVRVATELRPLDRYAAADAQHNLAHVYESGGRLVQASHAADRFIALAAGIRSDPIRVTSWHDAGLIRWKAGWHAAADAAFRAMVAAIDELQVAHFFAGEYYERTGRLSRALAYYRAGAQRDQEIENRAGLARVFEALGEPDSAIVAARSHDAAVERWNATALPLLPGVLARRGRTTEAARLLRTWVERQEAGGNRHGSALARLELAEVLLAGHRPEAAEEEARRAAFLATLVNLPAERVHAVRLAGRSLAALGRRGEAQLLLDSAARLAAALRLPAEALAAVSALGDLQRSAGDPTALASYARGARLVETLGLALAETHQAGFRERHLAPFDGALRALPDRAAPGAVLDWSARRKGVLLALSLGQGRGAAPTLAAVQRRLEPADAVIDYSVLDSLTLALVITRTTAAVVRLRAGREDLERLSAALVAPLREVYGGRLDLARAPFDVRRAAALHRLLLDPLRPHLAGATRVLVVPDAPLDRVPFEALVRSPTGAAARYVIDDHAVEYVPSLAVFGRAAPRAWTFHGSQMLAVGMEAPGETRELNALRRLGAVRLTALEHASASESAVLAALPGAALVHIAAHARADADDPLASHIRLEPDAAADGLLHMGEIAAARTSAHLVILSACETLAGRSYRGEGVISLGRAFLSAGAGSVIANLWPVSAEAADVAADFYSRLGAGRSSSQALREAKLVLRRDPRTAHPFYWAGMVLMRGRADVTPDAFPRRAGAVPP